MHYLKTIIIFTCLFFGFSTKTMEQDTQVNYTVWKDIDGTFKQLYYQSFSPNIDDSYTIFTGLTDKNIIKTIGFFNDTTSGKKYVINNVNEKPPLNSRSSLISEPKKIYYLPLRSDKFSNDPFEYYFAYVDNNQISLLKNRGITYNYLQNTKPYFYNTSYKDNLLYNNITSHKTPIKNIFSLSHQYTEEFSLLRKTLSKAEPKTYDVFGVISTSEYPSLKRTMFYFEHQKNQTLSIDQKVMDNSPGYIALAVHGNTMLYCKEHNYPTGIFGGIARRWRHYKNRSKSTEGNNIFQATVYISDVVKTDHSFYPLSKGKILTDNLQISHDNIPLAVMNEEYAIIFNKEGNNFNYTCTVFNIVPTKKLFEMDISPGTQIISPAFIIKHNDQNYVIFFDKNNIHWFCIEKSNTPNVVTHDLQNLLNQNNTLGDITASTYDPDKKMFYVAVKDAQYANKSIIAEIPFNTVLKE